MATANEKILDKTIDHQVDLQRFSNGVVRRLIAILNRSDASLSAKLAEALMQIEPSQFTVERLERLLADVREINSQAYAQVFPELQKEMQGLAEVESLSEAAMLQAAVPAPVQLRFPIAGLVWEQVYAAALARPFQGRLLKDWAKNVEAGRMTMIRNTVRQGFVEGKTTADIVKAVRGTKENNYEDGILNRGRRELQAVIQTALSHTAAVARDMSVKANEDIIKAVKWVSVLDGRTSEMCRIRDGLRYTADSKHKPIGHKIPWGNGPGQLHWNCRSTSIPITKDWRDLDFVFEELAENTRASMDGQVPADLTYGQWFAKQSAQRQNEIVGPVRAELFREGKVTFDKFYDDKGKWLTLEELMARIEK